MKQTTLLLLLPLAALAAEPEIALEPVDYDPAWRFSAGFRAAPGIKTSASVDARAAAIRAGGLLRAAGRGSGSAGTSVSVKTEDLGTETDGTTSDEAAQAAGWSEGRTRWDFDNGYIDLDDGADQPGETQNWHFESADDFADGAIQGRTAYSGTKTTRSRTTKTETSGSRSSSLREEWGEGIQDSSDKTAPGFELRLDRTVWETEALGLDVGIGWAWYDDVDAYSVRGRAYSAVATEKRTPSGSRVTTTDTTTTTKESGTVVTSISQPEFMEPDDYRNADGSMGGAVTDVYEPVLADGYMMPVLTVTQDRFSSSVEKDPTETSTSSSTSVRTTGAGGSGSSSTRTTRRTVDVRSEGTLSLQELRLGARPFWKATRWLSLRGDLGLLAVYSELETETVLSVDGAPAATIRRDDDDWTFGGYAGLAADFAATDELTLSLGAEARFPHRSIRFDDGVVSGRVRLAEWSVAAGVGWRF